MSYRKIFQVSIANKTTGELNQIKSKPIDLYSPDDLDSFDLLCKDVCKHFKSSDTFVVEIESFDFITYAEANVF